MLQISDQYIQQLFRQIYMGKVTQESLPPLLYFKIADYLKQGVYEGFGTTWTALSGEKLPPGFNMQDKELLSELRSNIYLFSAAKTYQQIRTMSSALISDDGTIVPFKQFREKAEQTYDLFNKTWLRTEYDTAIGQAQNARKWLDIEKNADILPLLEYSAVMDKRTSDICRHLDGIIAPVNDPIWKKIAPLNHFNCRCLLLQLSEGVPTGMDAKMEKVTEAETQMDDLFKMNPGQSGYVFSKDHPYFDIAPRDRGLAMRNFDLPIPKADPPSQAKIEAPAPGGFKPAKNIKEAEKWAMDNGISVSVKYSGISLENANNINRTLKMIFDDFQIQPLQEIKGGAKSLGAANGKMISFKKSATTPAEVKAQFESGVLNYQSRNLERMKETQLNIEKNINRPDVQKFYIKQLEQWKKVINYKRWTVHLKEADIVEDLFIHEAGHVLEDQLLGLINRSLIQKRFRDATPGTRLGTLKAKTEEMRKEWLSIYANLTADDLYTISKYGASDYDEVFAESLVMYYREPENMVPSIRKYFDKLKEYARTN